MRAPSRAARVTNARKDGLSDLGPSFPLSERIRRRRASRRGPPRADDARGQSRTALSTDRERRHDRWSRRLRSAVQPQHARQADQPLQHPAGADGARTCGMGEPHAARGAQAAARHPRHDLKRPAALVRQQSRHRDHGRPILPVAGDARVRCTRRPRPGGTVRRDRPTRVPRRRDPTRAALADRPRHGTTMGTCQLDLRAGPRRRRTARSRICPRTAGWDARSWLGRSDGETLPRRRPAEGRRGPALRLRP